MSGLASAEQAKQDYLAHAATSIKELSSASEKIPVALHIAGVAISNLTNTPVNAHPDETSPPDSLAHRKIAFREQAGALFTILTETKNAVTKQIEDLHAQGVVPKKKFAAPSGSTDPEGAGENDERDRKKEPIPITNGGLGKLNVAYLNARAGGARQDDSELLGRVQNLLDGMVREAEGEGEGEDHEMTGR